MESVLDRNRGEMYSLCGAILSKGIPMDGEAILLLLLRCQRGYLGIQTDVNVIQLKCKGVVPILCTEKGLNNVPEPP